MSLTQNKESIKSWVSNVITTCSGPRREGKTILTIDAGGMRGLVALEVLKALHEESNRPLHEMFDLIGGVSIGALLAFAIGVKKMNPAEVRKILREMRDAVFANGRSLPLPAYYDIANLEALLKRSDVFGETPLSDGMETSSTQHVFAVGTNVTSTPAKPTLFTTYRSASEPRYYLRNSNVKIWEAVSISCASPLLFESVPLGFDAYVDGGVLAKNPTSIALDEAKCIWGPNVKINCVVSIGCGLFAQNYSGDVFMQDLHANNTLTSNDPVRELDAISQYLKMFKMVFNNIGNAELIHHTLQTALAPTTPYYRLNPNIAETAVDEIDEPALARVLGQVEYFCKNHRREFQEICDICCAGKGGGTSHP